MKDLAFYIIAGAIYLGTLVALVRPSSKGPQLITNIFDSFSDLVRGSIGK